MTDLPSPDRSPRVRAIVALLLACMALLGAWDLATDSPRAWRGPHALIELGFILVAAVAAALLGRGWGAAERSLASTRRSLAEHRTERDAWQARAQNALRGLGEAMDQQFGAWGLTPTEKETALFLLKGYSHKEAARLCGRSERTVRQHAVSVYRKSGLAGRAELAAFFFEDMILPAGSVPAAPDAGRADPSPARRGPGGGTR